MATIDELTQQVNELTQQVNAITGQSKTISELDVQSPLEPTSVIPVTNNGADESITVQQISDSIKSDLENPESLILGIGADNVSLDEDGLRLNGTATAFEDLRVPTSSTKAGGSKEPTFAQLKDNGSGSQGVFIDWFDKSLEEELYFDVQLPHAWKEGTDIFPHVHWIPKTTGASGNFVRWGLEYTWSSVNELFGDTTIIYSDATSAATATVSGDAIMTADKHHISRIGVGATGIDGTNKKISSMLVCRVFRDATNGDDNYNYDAGLLEIDFHYEIDSLGSEEEYVKE